MEWYSGTQIIRVASPLFLSNGRERFKAYDPHAFAMFDDFYRGKMEPMEERGVYGHSRLVSPA
jgi:hypothetical protein